MSSFYLKIEDFDMKKMFTSIALAFCLGAPLMGAAAGQYTSNPTAVAGYDTATAAETVALAHQAATMILKDKEAALAEISKSDGKFVAGDSYVFVMNLEGKMLAHPFMPDLMSKNNMLSTPDKNVADPKMPFVEFVVVACTKGEGWVQYMWPKPGSTEPSIKDTYIYRVPGTDMLVGAGIYR